MRSPAGLVKAATLELMVWACGRKLRIDGRATLHEISIRLHEPGAKENIARLCHAMHHPGPFHWHLYEAPDIPKLSLDDGERPEGSDLVWAFDNVFAPTLDIVNYAGRLVT